MRAEPRILQGRKQTRCAIYTRKSTEEGLDRDFNTLDAQREAAEHFIRAQAQEGWIVVPKHYDDGGFTGANLERPALKQIMADIEGGAIDCVVVYKVDRLTRSLTDFSKMIDTFEKHAVTFVSVTQHFNTTESLGRLTLNILLSFAQFEREMISERTRDKMSAARRKGKWVGGNLVLGYDLAPDGRVLVVNKSESEQVREIFRLYLECDVLRIVVEKLHSRGWHLKAWTNKRGSPSGGGKFTKTTLHNLLTNVIYTGRVDYKGQLYAGEHKAIVDDHTWNQVQEKLNRNGRRGGRNAPNKYGALLKGLLHCDACNRRMTHTYTAKGPTIYRYYVCATAHEHGWNMCSTRSVSAPQLESAVLDQLRGIGQSPATLARVTDALRRSTATETSPSVSDVSELLTDFNALWEHLRLHEQEQFIRALVRQVNYDGKTESVTLAFHTQPLRELAGGLTRQRTLRKMN